MSGQGPYFGQAIHFKRGHPTHEAPVQIPSAIERYQTEIKRVVGVLDRHLTKQGTGYLVGGKLTYADLAFVPWNDLIKDAVPGWDVAPDAPTFAAWQKDMMERESVKRAFEKRADMVKWFRETRPPL